MINKRQEHHVLYILYKEEWVIMLINLLIEDLGFIDQ